jgi:hypothetical protein
MWHIWMSMLVLERKRMLSVDYRQLQAVQMQEVRQSRWQLITGQPASRVRPEQQEKRVPRDGPELPGQQVQPVNQDQRDQPELPGQQVQPVNQVQRDQPDQQVQPEWQVRLVQPVQPVQPEWLVLPVPQA